ncbi:MAG: cation:proton antiporter [Candidatus Azotimanducaceae bacterium WSBS_2022_MAG_OTU7]
MEPLVILLAFIAGLAFKKLGYPPLPGYLIAGFVAHELSLGEVALITSIADLGILLLLFTIGLKLDMKELLAPQVWAVAGLQIALAVPLTTLVIIGVGIVFPILALGSISSAWVLALALSFSSTVFAVKVFEDRGESASFHAKLAIGILVIQDIIAVSFMVVVSEKLPSLWALALPLLFFARPVLNLLLSLSRHSELVILFGILLAVGGAEVFELVGLKGGLGALFFGFLLSNSPLSKELYSSLIGFKDMFLIGFFLQIGYYGFPEQHMWLVAGALVALIFLRPVIYYFLFVAFRLRARTSLLASSALFNYSEFGLVVAAFAVSAGVLPQEWITTIALAVTLSFFVATPINAGIHRFYLKYGPVLQRAERAKRLPAETPTNLGDAAIVVLGMGRVGQGAYQRLVDLQGKTVVGVEENYEKVQAHRAKGIDCVQGDATDFDFWAHSGLRDKTLILICLSNHSENLVAMELARESDYSGELAVVSRFPDQREALEKLGCIAFNLYGEAGHGFADHVMERLSWRRP